MPDVAGNADPVTGYLVVVDGQKQPIGGTSAVAPLWAALIARLAQATGKNVRPAPAAAYAGVTAGTAARASTTSSMATTAPTSAGPGWDACTGLGSPNGVALLKLLSGPTPAAR